MNHDQIQNEVGRNVLASQMMFFVEDRKPGKFKQIKLSREEYWRLYGFIMHSIIGNRTDSPIKPGKQSNAERVIPFMTGDYEIEITDNMVRPFYNLDN